MLCFREMERSGEFPRLIDVEFHNSQVSAINYFASFYIKTFHFKKPAFYTLLCTKAALLVIFRALGRWPILI